MSDSGDRDRLLIMTADVVSAYVSNNPVPLGELPAVIENVYSSLDGVSVPSVEPPVQAPAVPIKKSVNNDAISCLECARRFKTIKLHINRAHGLNPAEYREKWGLRPDYPMTAPGYSEERSAQAKAIGLGQKARRVKLARRGRKKAA